MYVYGIDLVPILVQGWTSTYRHSGWYKKVFEFLERVMFPPFVCYYSQISCKKDLIHTLYMKLSHNKQRNHIYVFHMNFESQQIKK